jgi:hypothetical protein
MKGAQAVLPHQAGDAMLAAGLSSFPQVQEDARGAVDALTRRDGSDSFSSTGSHPKWRGASRQTPREPRPDACSAGQGTTTNPEIRIQTDSGVEMIKVIRSCCRGRALEEAIGDLRRTPPDTTSMATAGRD